MELDEFSRLKRTEPTIFDGKETFGPWKQFNFLIQRPSEDLIGVFQVPSALEGRPDMIAFHVYGTPLLDWVLIAFNNARGALNWPRTGDLVEYPLDSVVLPEIL